MIEFFVNHLGACTIAAAGLFLAAALVIDKVHAALHPFEPLTVIDGEIVEVKR